MSKQKIVYIISDIDKALGFEWVAFHLSVTFDLSYILIGKENTSFHNYLLEKRIRCYIVSDADYPSYSKKWLKIYSILKNERPEIVHVHLWRAMLLGLTTAWFLGIKKRITTRHHATIHYDQYPSGRKWDVMCNAMATRIIAISKNIEDILVKKDKVTARKIVRIPHGFSFEYFTDIHEHRIESLKLKYTLSSDNHPVIGVISRYTEWKGVQYIIPAFKNLLKFFPNAHLILANAHGNYTEAIQESLRELPAKSFTEIKFEEDLVALYHLFDVFVHVPINHEVEAFGQTYIEALLVGIPSVVTLSGIAREFIHDRKNAVVVDFESSDQIFNGMLSLLQDNSLREGIIQGGKYSVEQFSIESHISQLEKLYGAEH
jgi:glycosyltransferase involved in cell wall biosynthesis